MLEKPCYVLLDDAETAQTDCRADCRERYTVGLDFRHLACNMHFCQSVCLLASSLYTWEAMLSVGLLYTWEATLSACQQPDCGIVI